MTSFSNTEILNQDVLEYEVPQHPYKLVANIPYYITSPILRHFLRRQHSLRPTLIVLMIQKEVAQRICDLKKPGLLSWEVRVFGEPEIVCVVPPESFSPAPKVDSAVLKIRLFESPLVPHELQEPFFSLLEVAFKQPRKTLLNNLMQQKPAQKQKILEYLVSEKLDDRIRPHQLDLETWLRLLTFWRAI